jgi:hypothetical protein
VFRVVSELKYNQEGDDFEEGSGNGSAQDVILNKVITCDYIIRYNVKDDVVCTVGV